MNDHLGDLLFDVRFAAEPVRFGDELREPYEHVSSFGQTGQTPESFPESKRVRECCRVRDLPVEKHALGGNKNIFEDHKASGQ